MRLVAFLGDGLPPRALPCYACGAPILLGQSVYVSDGYSNGTNGLCCTLGCYLEKFPGDPDAAKALQGTTPPPTSPSATDDPIW